jgi:hypothetical protein
MFCCVQIILAYGTFFFWGGGGVGLFYDFTYAFTLNKYSSPQFHFYMSLLFVFSVNLKMLMTLSFFPESEYLGLMTFADCMCDCCSNDSKKQSWEVLSSLTIITGHTEWMMLIFLQRPRLYLTGMGPGHHT